MVAINILTSRIPWYAESRGELICEPEVFSNFHSSVVGTCVFYLGLNELWHTAITYCPEPSVCYPQAQLAGAWALTASFHAPLWGQILGKIYSLSKLEKLSLLTAELCWEDQGSSQRSRTPAVDLTCVIRILLRRWIVSHGDVLGFIWLEIMQVLSLRDERGPEGI